MGVDAEWERFPLCPEMSRFVAVCPLLSFLGLGTGTNRDKRGQMETKRDIPGGCTPRGSCNRTLLRRVLRRFSNNKCFLEGFLEGACEGFQ